MRGAQQEVEARRRLLPTPRLHGSTEPLLTGCLSATLQVARSARSSVVVRAGYLGSATNQV
jgi:hypothetical protein